MLQSPTTKFKVLSTDFIIELLTKKSKIGEGATSIVYKVKNLFTKKGFLCVKVLKSEVFKKNGSTEKNEKKKKTIWDDDDDDLNEEEEEKIEINMEIIKQLFQEYEMLTNLNHPNIIQVYGFYFGEKTHNPSILLEYCSCNLEKAISELEDIELVGIIYEICSAMKYVHENKIIHRDLKMKNILVNKDKHIRICDFGISKSIDITTLTSMTHGIGTFAFMAPEIINPKAKYDEKVDIYSFGVILYFILTKGELPTFTGIGEYVKLDLPNKINQLSQSIIKKCWATLPNERPSFTDILQTMKNNNYLLIDGIEKKIPFLKNYYC